MVARVNSVCLMCVLRTLASVYVFVLVHLIHNYLPVINWHDGSVALLVSSERKSCRLFATIVRVGSLLTAVR